jgi:hypothetical protein
MARRPAFAALLSLVAGHASAFDAEGFESGATRAEVMRIAGKRFGRVENAGEFLLARLPMTDAGPTQMQFWFCRDRLVMASANARVPLSLRNLMAVAQDELRARGQPLRIDTRDGFHGGLGESRELTFLWHTRPDYLNVSFEYFEKAEGQVTHAWFAHNDCLRPHWMHDIETGSGEARDNPHDTRG